MAGWKDKRRVMHRYDLTADMYEERYAEEQAAKYKVALENLKLRGGPILDVGCGTGMFFPSVAAQASIVVGVDISRKLLLKAYAQAKKWSNVFVLLADADHLPLRDGFFETVFGFTILQNMPTPPKTMIELRRVADSRGAIVVTGLKRFFAEEAFMRILDDASLKVKCFLDREDLKCYVAVLSAE